MAADTLPTTTSAVHSTIAAKSADQENDPAAATPAARVFGTDDTTMLASADVNRVTCRAVVGTGPGKGIQWLGTQCGVKAIDAAGHEVRHWTRRDGLPGEYVESIAVPVGGERVYCLVRVGGPEKLALCAIGGTVGDRWKTLGTIDADIHRSNDNSLQDPNVDDSWIPRFGRSHVVAVAGGAIVATSAVEWHTDALLHYWSDARSTLNPIPWDPSQRADTDVLGVNDVWTDGKSDVAVATTRGLVTLTLGGAGPTNSARFTTTYRRFLPDKSVEAIATAPAAAGRSPRLFIAFRDRRLASVDPQLAWQHPIAPWSLGVFEMTKGSFETLTPRDDKAESAVYQSNGRPGVESLTVSEDGSVWATVITRMSFPGNWPQNPGGFSRYDPATRTWTEYQLNGLTPKQVETSGGDWQRLNQPAPASAVPDDAVSVLALSTISGGSALRSDSDPNIDFNGHELLKPWRWRVKRFPLWNCPEETAARADRERMRDAAVVAQPGDAIRWTANGQDLVSAPEKSNTSVARRYSLHGGVHLVAAHVLMIAPQTPASRSVAIETTSGVYLIAENAISGSLAWKMLGGSQRDRGDSDVYNEQIARTGPQHRLTMLRRENGQIRLSQFDTQADAFVDLKRDVPQNAVLAGSSDAGCWLRENNTLYFLGGEGAAQKIEANLPEGLRPNDDQGRNPVGVTGSIAWYQMRIARRQSGAGSRDAFVAVIGYDVLAHRWTAPQPVDDSGNGRARVVAGADGVPYCGFPQPGTAVFRYDAAHDLWGPIAPAIPVTQTRFDGWFQVLDLISVDDRDIYATDRRCLLRFDRRAAVWSTFKLPSELNLVDGRNPDDLWSLGTATTAAVFIGSNSGLWRFDRARQTWLAIVHPISLEPQLPRPSEPGRRTTSDVDTQAGGRPGPVDAPHTDMPVGVEIDVSAVDARSVWGNVRPFSREDGLVYRFDRRTQEFTIFDATSGLPGSLDGYTLRSDGDSIWALGGRGSYRLSSRQHRFTPLFLDDANQAAAKGAAPGRVCGVAGDPADPDAAYVALRDGTSGAILYHLHKTSERLDPMPFKSRVSGAAGPPSELHGTGGLLVMNDRLWMGTSAGVFVIDPLSGIWEPAPLPESLPSMCAVSDIHSGTDGAIWIIDAHASLRIAPNDRH